MYTCFNWKLLIILRKASHPYANNPKAHEWNTSPLFRPSRTSHNPACLNFGLRQACSPRIITSILKEELIYRSSSKLCDDLNEPKQLWLWCFQNPLCFKILHLEESILKPNTKKGIKDSTTFHFYLNYLMEERGNRRGGKTTVIGEGVAGGDWVEKKGERREEREEGEERGENLPLMFFLCFPLRPLFAKRMHQCINRRTLHRGEKMDSFWFQNQKNKNGLNGYD